MKQEDKALLKKLYSASTAGIYMVVATMIGFYIGYKLDQWFHTDPWLKLLFLVFGIAAGFKNLIMIGIRESRDSKDEGQE